MVRILDSTLREGELHPGVYFTPQSVRVIARSLAEIGTCVIELPLAYGPRGTCRKDVEEAVRDVHENHDGVSVILQCRAFQEDIEEAATFDVDGCGVFLGITEEHRQHKLRGMTREKAIQQLAESVEFLRNHGFKYRRATLEDVSRYFTEDNPDSMEYLTELAKSMQEAGADPLGIPDTSGILCAGKVAQMVQTFRKITSLPLSAHFHNDYGNALSNALEAVMAGVEEIHVTIYGLGARNGITDHYELVANLEDLHDIPTGEKRDKLSSLYRTFEATTSIQIPWRHPLSDVCNVEKAGTHQAQVIRSPRGYIPEKKVIVDFDGEVHFEAGKLISKRVVSQLLEGHRVDETVILETANAIAARSALKHRRLSPLEVKEIIRAKTGIQLPIEQISGLIRGGEVAYYLIKLKPQAGGREIVNQLITWSGIIQADQVYGEVDLVVLGKLRDENGVAMADKIRNTYRGSILEMNTWILE